MSGIKYVIQNVDTNLTRSGLKDEMDRLGRNIDTTVMVKSIFNTIQGEGPFAGYPATFVRLAGCNFGAKNVACHFCDTDFALSKAVGHDAVYLARHLDAQVGKVQPLIVLTGGEPMMQPAVKLFIETLLEQNYKVQVETNGTHPQVLQSWTKQAFSILDESPELTFVLSPKAVGDTDKWPAPNPIFWAYDTYLKCLIEDDENSAYYQVPHWVTALVEEFPRFNERVFVSPMAAYSKAYSGEVSSAWEPGLLNVTQTKKNYNYAGRYALEHGFRLSIQQHLFVSMA